MSTQWVNTQPDAGALHALLLSLPARVPISDIDHLWIFPTRKIAVGESTVVVLSLFDADAERRRVMTARFTVSRDKKGVAKVADKLDEYGTATLDELGRVVEGVLRRLGEEVEQPPRDEEIAGDVTNWQALLIDLGAPKSAFDEPAPADDGASADDAVASDVSASPDEPAPSDDAAPSDESAPASP
jgi:hypothetical protein